jgi:hypothetical protein
MIKCASQFFIKIWLRSMDKIQNILNIYIMYSILNILKLKIHSTKGISQWLSQTTVV